MTKSSFYTLFTQLVSRTVQSNGSYKNLKTLFNNMATPCYIYGNKFD